MLRFDQVGFSYADALPPALQGIDLQLSPGRYIVLLGANGSGKTTLAHLANGLLQPQHGQVTVDGLDAADPQSLHELRQLVGLVYQDPDEQIICTTVADEVAFGPENLGLDPSEIALRVDQALAEVGLSGLAERDPGTLSGGQRQRLALAGVLAMRPRYLVLDEPTAMLDAPGRLLFLETLSALRRSGCGILHITHDLSLASEADELAVLDAGRMAYAGPPGPLLADGPSLLAWSLAAPMPEDGRREAPVAAAGRRGRADLASELRLDDVRFSYPGAARPGEEVLGGVSLGLAAGSYTLVSGNSGTGKSTLLRLIAGLLKPSSGSVERLHNGRAEPLRPGMVGLVFQSPEDQLFAASVAEDIAFGPKNLGIIPSRKGRGVDLAGDRLEADLVGRALESVGLDVGRIAHRSPFALSGGEMRRVAIAGVLAMQPGWLIFDEPTAGLDAQGKAFVHALIASQLAQGTAVLVVSHDVNEFAGRVGSHLRLEGGRLWPS